MSEHPVVPRSDGEREREIRERSPRLSVADAGKHYHADVEFLCALLSDLREQVGRAQRDSERLDWIESVGCVDVWVPSASASPPLTLRWSLDDSYLNDTSLRAAIDSAKSAAVARETGE